MAGPQLRAGGLGSHTDDPSPLPLGLVELVAGGMGSTRMPTASYSMSGDDGAVQFTHTIGVGLESRWGILDVPCGDELGAGKRRTNSHHRSSFRRRRYDADHKRGADLVSHIPAAGDVPKGGERREPFLVPQRTH